MQRLTLEMAGRIAMRALVSAIISLGLSVTAAFFVAGESGRSTSSQATNILVYLGYWPSLTMGFMNDNICSLRQLIANSSGWSVVVVLVSLIDLRFSDRI
jgi:hypothetical protein